MFFIRSKMSSSTKFIQRKNFPFKNRKRNQQSDHYSWILQRPWTPDENSLTRPPQYDFDAWLYIKPHPQQEQNNILFPQLLISAEDIKFAFNCYNFLRVCRFFGLHQPSVVGSISNCTPPMDIAARGNRIFYLNCDVNTPLKKNVVKIGLTAHPSKGMSIKDVDWKKVVSLKDDIISRRDVDWRREVMKSSNTAGETDDGIVSDLGNNNNNSSSTLSPQLPAIQLVVGMENGMSDSIADQCDFCVHIPQYGSIGSLSMINALSVGVHDIFTGLRGKTLPVITQSRSLSAVNEGKEELFDEVCQGPDTNNVGKLYPHADNLLGKNDASINHNLALRRNSYPLQLSLLWWNALGDRNIGATIRNANIYNVEHMIILNRRKYSRRGTVGCHHYTPVHHLRDLDEVNDLGLLDGYEKWVLVNDYPYLCNYAYAEKKGIIQDYNLLCGNEEAAKYIFGVDDDDDSGANPETVKKPLIHLDNEEEVLAQLNKAKFERGARGIVIVVPDEGSSPLPELDAQCNVRIRLVNPKNFAADDNDDEKTWRDHQAGLPGSLSTALVLDKLRSLIAVM